MHHPIFDHPAIQQYSERHTWGRAMRWHSSLDETLVGQLWDTPARLIETSLPLQDKERCLVARINTSAGLLVLKRQNWGGPWKTFCKSLRTPQARQSFLDGLYLAEQGISTPRPLALVERKWGPFGGHSYLLTEFVTGTSLYRSIRFDNPPRQFVLYLADQVAKLCQRLYELRVSHNDLKPENLMIDPTGRVWVIDLEKMRRHDRFDELAPRLLEDVRRLLHPRNWRENLPAAEIFRTSLLKQPAVAEALRQVDPKEHPLLHPELIARGHTNRLSVLITTHSAEEDVSATTESIRDIADEIVVADFHSSVVEQPAGASVVRIAKRAEETSLAYYNRTLASTGHPWVLWLAADERVSPDLAKEIQCLLSTDYLADGYRMSRRRTYLGQVCKYGGTRCEAPPRLFRRDNAEFAISSDRPLIQLKANNIGRMNAKLIERCSANVETLFRSMNEHTSHLAAARFAAGERPKLFRAGYDAVRSFAWDYFLRLSILDGRVGLQASLHSAAAGWLTEAKLWELHFSKGQQSRSEPVTNVREYRQAA